MCWLALLPQQSARAESDSVYDRSGWYVRGGVAAGFFDAHRGDVDFDPGAGFAAAVGYRYNSYLVGEAGFAHFWNADTEDYEKLGGDTDVTKRLSAYELTCNIKTYPLGYWPADAVSEWIQPYALLGIGVASAEVGSEQNVRFLLRFGAGLDFLFTEQYGVYMEYAHSVITSMTTGSGGSLLDGQGQLGAGVLYRF